MYSAAFRRRAIFLSPQHGVIQSQRKPRRPKSTSSTPVLAQSATHLVDVDELLQEPTWSVASLLPGQSQDLASSSPTVTTKQLHHLLRLSALPMPSSAKDEAEMLATLSSQLYFVQQIQQVDTNGIKPLQSLRDETEEGEKAAQLGLGELGEALAQETVRGEFHPRIRRTRTKSVTDPTALASTPKEWKALDTAAHKVGRFFVVDGDIDR